MNRNDSNKTTMDWILGIHALLLKGRAEQAEGATFARGNDSESGQSLEQEGTHALTRRVCDVDSANHPIFNPDAARFVRGIHAGLSVGAASVELSSVAR